MGIQLQLILTTYFVLILDCMLPIVNSGWKLVQLHNPITDQTFNEMKQELWTAQSGNAIKIRNWYKRSNAGWDNVVVKREIDEKKSSEPSASTNQTSDPPIELYDIGYDSSWEKFCDPQQIDKDFAFYLEHELRTLRYLICDMKKENQISRETMSPFLAYKYCEMMRYRVDTLLEKLVTRIVDNDKEKKKFLLTDKSYVNETSPCFTTTSMAFEKKCIDQKNPYCRMFKPILARACASKWLKMDTILLSVDEVCVDRISGDIDWRTIINTVPYRRSKG